MNFFSKMWHRISYSGVHAGLSDDMRKKVIITNRMGFIAFLVIFKSIILLYKAPTLLTISASLLLLEDTTWFVERNCWYCCLAIVCNSDSGNKVSWLLPVSTFVEQATTNTDKRKKLVIFCIIWISLYYNIQSLYQVGLMKSYLLFLREDFRC